MANTSSYLKGVIEILLLGILSKGERYGYELTNVIGQYSDGLLDIPLGTLYPTLYRLQESGYVAAENRMAGKRLRTYYSLTKEGVKYYQAVKKEYENVVAGVKNVLLETEAKQSSKQRKKEGE